MDNDFVKKLTGKDQRNFELAAAHIINNCDVEAFRALVDKSDFLFEFIKENVKKRLLNVITKNNYKNLLAFFIVYSHDYEDVVVSSLVKYADEDLTDEMLNKLEKGTDDEKAYCAKYFSKINDTLALDLLRKYSYSDYEPLALNCAEALSAMQDEESYELAIGKLKSEDEFEKLSAVKFLVAYKDIRALENLFDCMKKSSMPENVASEIPYLQNFLELADSKYKDDVVLALNYILNGLGEIISLSQVFDFELFEILQKLLSEQESKNDSKLAVLLVNAKLKFEQLTENDEYIFDEDKIIKEEIYAINELLHSSPLTFWKTQEELVINELATDSEVIFSALEIVQELKIDRAFAKLNELTQSQNQTIILKSMEVIKSLNKLGEVDKNAVMNRVSDGNIKLILESLFA